jgi:hypothetical protein
MLVCSGFEWLCVTVCTTVVSADLLSRRLAVKDPVLSCSGPAVLTTSDFLRDQLLVPPPTPCHQARSMGPPPVSMTLTTPPGPGHAHLTTEAPCLRVHWRTATGTTGNILVLLNTLGTLHTTILAPQGDRTGDHSITRGATGSLPLMRGTVAQCREE